jgi:ABC-type nitrate/sulfonate/bicarbonate transport system substrate-binding protein
MRRLLTTLVLAVLAAATAVACGSDGGTNARTAVTVVLDWTPNTNHAGLYLARDKGLYAKAGLDVTIIEPDENGGLPMLAAGQADFAVSVAESLLPARAEGADVVSVAAILAHNTSSLVIPADRGVRTAKDLEGKTYGGFGGELEKALLDRLVTCAGGDPTKVRSVEVGNVDYAVGFQQKQFDAVWVFDGWDVIRLRELEKMPVTTIPFLSPAGSPECIPDWYTPLLATSGATIKARPAVVEAFLEATAAGYELARTDPATASKTLLAAAPELDAELVTKSAEYLASRYGDAGKPWGVQDAGVWQRFAAFLVDNRLLAEGTDAEAAFTNTFLPGGSAKPGS